MISTFKSSYTDAQIIAWLRGLYTIAWADGNYDPEEEGLIAKLTAEIACIDKITNLEPITPEELATSLGKEPTTAENFLRTAVLVAVADGVYSPPEYELICKFSDALDIEVEALKSLENTLYRQEENQADAGNGPRSIPGRWGKSHRGTPIRFRRANMRFLKR